MERARQAKPLKGLAAGLAAGLVATFAMTQFQNAWLKAAEALSPEQAKEQKKDEQGENATVKVARVLSQSVLHHGLSPEKKRAAGMVVHYAFGTAMGGIYGVNAELFHELATAGFGTLH